MVTSVQEFFRRKLGQSYDPRLNQLQGTIRFDVEGAGSWRLRVDHGRLEIEESDEPAECTIRVSAADLLQILNGQRHIMTTFLQGHIQFTGDRSLAAGMTNFLRKAAA